jgi:AraC-like DNA-binding protein
MIETRRPTTFDAVEPWRVNLEDAFNELVPETLEPQCDPRGTLHGVEFGPVAMFLVSGTPQVVRRSTSAVRHAPADSIKVCVQLRGRATIHQGGREIVLDPGHLAVYDIAKPYALRLEGMWSCAVMAVPRDEIDMSETDLEIAMDRVYAAGHGPGLVLAEFVRAAAGQVRSPASPAAVKLGTAGSSLLVGTLIDCDDLAADTAADGLRSHVMAYIRSNLDDPRLSRSSIAAAHHLSPRTLDRLFAEEEFSVSGYIRQARLEAVRRDLEDPALLHRSVSALAAQWCFVDAAHFSRMFRRQYGYPPSHARPSRPRIAS